jgi:altronate hydrolase
MESLTDDFLKYIVGVASGNQTKNEENDYFEIAIFKDGVTL